MTSKSGWAGETKNPVWIPRFLAWKMGWIVEEREQIVEEETEQVWRNQKPRPCPATEDWFSKLGYIMVTRFLENMLLMSVTFSCIDVSFSQSSAVSFWIFLWFELQFYK